MSSAAVVIGALRVKIVLAYNYLQTLGFHIQKATGSMYNTYYCLHIVRLHLLNYQIILE